MEPESNRVEICDVGASTSCCGVNLAFAALGGCGALFSAVLKLGPDTAVDSSAGSAVGLQKGCAGLGRGLREPCGPGISQAAATINGTWRESLRHEWYTPSTWFGGMLQVWCG